MLLEINLWEMLFYFVEDSPCFLAGLAPFMGVQLDTAVLGGCLGGECERGEYKGYYERHIFIQFEL